MLGQALQGDASPSKASRSAPHKASRSAPHSPHSAPHCSSPLLTVTPLQRARACNLTLMLAVREEERKRGEEERRGGEKERSGGEEWRRGGEEGRR